MDNYLRLVKDKNDEISELELKAEDLLAYIKSTELDIMNMGITISKKRAKLSTICKEKSYKKAPKYIFLGILGVAVLSLGIGGIFWLFDLETINMLIYIIFLNVLSIIIGSVSLEVLNKQKEKHILNMSKKIKKMEDEILELMRKKKEASNEVDNKRLDYYKLLSIIDKEKKKIVQLQSILVEAYAPLIDNVDIQDDIKDNTKELIRELRKTEEI